MMTALRDLSVIIVPVSRTQNIGSAVAGMSVPDSSQDESPSGNPLCPAKARPGHSGEEPANEADLNNRAGKLAFRQTTRQSPCLNSRLTEPVSPFELKTGTVIPSILVGESDFDFPGKIVAQVSQNVCDTASDNHLLIPQGTELLGRLASRLRSESPGG
jgi:type IV secretory pathway VirB10-like protein